MAANDSRRVCGRRMCRQRCFSQIAAQLLPAPALLARVHLPPVLLEMWLVVWVTLSTQQHLAARLAI